MNTKKSPSLVDLWIWLVSPGVAWLLYSVTPGLMMLPHSGKWKSCPIITALAEALSATYLSASYGAHAVPLCILKNLCVCEVITLMLIWPFCIIGGTERALCWVSLMAGSEMLVLLFHMDEHSSKGGGGRGRVVVMDRSKIVSPMIEGQLTQMATWKFRADFPCLRALRQFVWIIWPP